VGKVGVAIASLADMELMMKEIPLEKVTTSMTINATAAILLAFYVALAKKQGADLTKIGGTTQNDILKEYIARGTYIYPPEPSLRLVADIFRFTSRAKMSFNPISISGYHMREAGATAVQELGFTFANALEYVRRAQSAGLAVDDFAPRLSFFFAAYTDLFEEIAKFRAARRLWYRLMKEKFNAADAAARLRFHTQTGGATLTAQQPLNNVVRVAIQAMAAVLGGTQSLHTNSFDEALALPTERSATLALRTQQLLAHETGVPDVVDPLGGSWYVEELTDKIETEARRLVEEVEAGGGSVKAIERGFFQEAIARSAYEQQRDIEAGKQVVVGVNEYVTAEPIPPIAAPDYSKLAGAQKQRLKALREQREPKKVKQTLAALNDAARQPSAPLMEPMLDAVRARATLGEISDVLRSVWGMHDAA